jgi:peptide/nickel transport system substrate-binding protein
VVVNEPGVRHTFEKHANYFDSTIGHADEVEILVINDNTARTAALQSGQIHMINRVDPKIVELLKGVPGIRSRPWRAGALCLHHACDKAPFDNNDLRMALKYGDQPAGDGGQDPGRAWLSRGNDFPINAAYPLFDDKFEQREYDAAKAAEHYKRSRAMTAARSCWRRLRALSRARWMRRTSSRPAPMRRASRCR